MRTITFALKAALLGALSALFVGCAVLAFFAGMLGLLALAVYLAGWHARAWLVAQRSGR